MRRVILESPYAGKQFNNRMSTFERYRNILYARLAVRDSLGRGEAPIASHLLYTQPRILNDQDAAERLWGIEAGMAWGDVADATVAYIDFGITQGMEYGLDRAEKAGRPVEKRRLSESFMQSIQHDELAPFHFW